MIIVAILLVLFFAWQVAHAEPLRGGCALSTFKGMIGARINKNGFVSCVRYRSPAQLAGLRPGDRITRVDFAGFSLGRINGHAGESVRLSISRKDEILELEIPYADARAIDYKTSPDRYFDEMGGWHEWATEHENT